MRYSRQERLKIIPNNFQEDIRNKKIVLVGCGGVGSVLSELLVRGGFLNLVVVDNDLIDETNLQRQNFEENDVGKSKSATVCARAKKIDKDAVVVAIEDLVTANNCAEIFGDCDLIVDCSDNFDVRRVINSYCESMSKDWVYTGAIKTEVASCIFYGEERKFSKVFPKKIEEEQCCDVGVLASTTFAAASLGYNQIVKYFIGEKDDKLVIIELWKNKLFKVGK